MQINKKWLTSLVLVVMVTLPLMSVKIQATDLKGHWAEDTIKEFIDKGVVKGVSKGQYQPDKPISREEAAVFIARYMGLKGEANSQFADIKGRWSESAIAQMEKEGWIKGYPDGTFKPRKLMTRQEYSLVVYRVLDKEVDFSKVSAQGFGDLTAVYGKEKIEQLAGLGIIHGFDDGNFKSNQLISRAETVVMLSNVDKVEQAKPELFKSQTKKNIKNKKINKNKSVKLVKPSQSDSTGGSAGNSSDNSGNNSGNNPQQVFDKNKIKKMTIKKMPKVSYQVGELFDMTGLKLTLVDSNNLTKVIDSKELASYGIDYDKKEALQVTDKVIIFNKIGTNPAVTVNLPIKVQPNLEILKVEKSEFSYKYASDVSDYLPNIELRWKDTDEAVRYEVLINGHKMVVDGQEKDFEPQQGANYVGDQVRFRTLSDSDFEIEQTDQPQTISFIIRAKDKDGQVFAEGKHSVAIPVKGAVNNLMINGVKHQDKMKVTNPVCLQLSLNHSLKNEGTIPSYIKLKQGYNELEYQYDVTPQDQGVLVTVRPLGGLVANKEYQLIIDKRLKTNYGSSFVKENTAYKFVMGDKVAEELTVKRALLNDNQAMDVSQQQLSNVVVDSKMVLYFNQLIDSTSYEKAQGGEPGGKKGVGIYLTKSKDGKGDDSARLLNPVWQVVEEDGRAITKLTFDMAGRAGYYEHEPLDGDTIYYLVIEKILKSETGTTLNKEQRFAFNTGQENPKKYVLEMKNGVIVEGDGVTEAVNKAEIAKGTTVTVKAEVPEGKQFKGWYRAVYLEEILTDEQFGQEQISFTMPGQDVYLEALLEDAANSDNEDTSPSYYLGTEGVKEISFQHVLRLKFSKKTAEQLRQVIQTVTVDGKQYNLNVQPNIKGYYYVGQTESSLADQYLTYIEFCSGTFEDWKIGEITIQFTDGHQLVYKK